MHREPPTHLSELASYGFSIMLSTDKGVMVAVRQANKVSMFQACAALAEIGVQWRHCVHGFPCVGAPRDAETEGEVVALDQLVTKVMPLDHTEVAHFLRPNRENQPAHTSRGVGRRPKYSSPASGDALCAYFKRGVGGAHVVIILGSLSTSSLNS